MRQYWYYNDKKERTAEKSIISQKGRTLTVILSTVKIIGGDLRKQHKERRIKSW